MRRMRSIRLPLMWAERGDNRWDYLLWTGKEDRKLVAHIEKIDDRWEIFYGDTIEEYPWKIFYGDSGPTLEDVMSCAEGIVCNRMERERHAFDISLLPEEERERIQKWSEVTCEAAREYLKRSYGVESA